MKTLEDVKAVVYREKDVNLTLVSKFLKTDSEKYTYTDEDSLGIIIDNLKKKFNSKEVIILKEFKGRFFQMCPGTPEMICCNYRLINTGFNCLYDCAYCYLQLYLNSFGIVIFTNMDEVLRELDHFLLEMDPEKVYRIGTGEFTDSLMIDDTTSFGELLIEKLSAHKNIFFELKSKSDIVDHLLNIHPKGNAVLGWSMNTPSNINSYEKDTADLEMRLNAAEKSVKAGYYAAFHFDPIILYNNWEEEYAEVIRKIFSHVNGNKIVWISLGGVRYNPSFKDIIRNNFPDEKITSGEFFPAKDGKYRYLKPLRKKVYSFFKSEIEKYSKTPYIYMCMEADYMWEDVFGYNFTTSEEFEDHFADYLQKTFLL